MISLIVLLAAGAYIALWYLLVRALPNRWAKAFVALIAVYLPFWDVPYGYYNFQKLCKAEGGTHVFEKFAPQTAVFLSPTALTSPRNLFQSGFSVVERSSPDNKFVRISSASPTEVLHVSREGLISLYGIRSNSNNDWRETRLFRRDFWIYSIRTDAPVARKTELRWNLWIQSLAMPILGTGWWCNEPIDQPSVERLLAMGTGK